MKIRLGYDISFECPRPTPKLLMLKVHPSRQHDVLTPEVVTVTPSVPVSTYLDGFGNRCMRVTAPEGTLNISSDFMVNDTGEPDEEPLEAIQHAVEDVPDDAIQFLLASRYCDTEALSDEAWSLFGATPLGYRRVKAICDFVHERITFGYQHARSTRTASEGFSERLGVCRDFAHLAVTLCRCMNIPARYCTGYLGDIGVPIVPEPMDFSAWFEVYLGGRWYTFDARHNKRRIGRVVIGRGRDATDVAISTTFGPSKLTKFEVITLEQ